MGFNKKEYMKKWREEHKNEIKEYNKNYSNAIIINTCNPLETMV